MFDRVDSSVGSFDHFVEDGEGGLRGLLHQRAFTTLRTGSGLSPEERQARPASQPP